jgi:hypothetical protein
LFSIKRLRILSPLDQGDKRELEDI